MGVILTPLEMTGRIGEFTAYKRKGSDKIIFRRKGGPSKKQVLQDPHFETTRLHLSDFGACNKLTAGIRRAIARIKHLGDPNFTGALNKTAKNIQEMNTEAFRGQRSIFLSRHRHMLSGFQLNSNYPFDGLLRHPLSVHTDRAQASATVVIPHIQPGIALALPWQAPFYRVIITLGIVGDILYHPNGFHPSVTTYPHSIATEWRFQAAESEQTELFLQLQEPLPNEASLVLGIGIEMGKPDRHGVIATARYAGSAKILEVF